MPHAHWEHFEHKADIGVKGSGNTLPEAFEQTAVAMVAVITDPLGVAEQESVEVDCQAPDLELLLVDWLNALIYEMAVRRMVFGRFEVKLDGTQLHGVAWGEHVNREKHDPAVEIKGATYTELKVAQDTQGIWQAQCVVDV